MIEIIRNFGVAMWNCAASVCLWAQGQFSTTTLVVTGIIALVGFIYATNVMENKGATPVILLSLLAFVLLFVFGVIVGFGDFAHRTTNEGDGVLACGIIWILLLLIWLAIIGNGVSLGFLFQSILSIICTIVCLICFSKYIIYVAILGGIGVFAGGSKFVGTFTDKDGNSYDVYKND